MVHESDWRDARAELAAELQSELTRLALAASAQSPVEAVMRVRALSEIASLMDTDSLLRLARNLAEPSVLPGSLLQSQPCGHA